MYSIIANNNNNDDEDYNYHYHIENDNKNGGDDNNYNKMISHHIRGKRMRITKGTRIRA